MKYNFFRELLYESDSPFCNITSQKPEDDTHYLRQQHWKQNRFEEQMFTMSIGGWNWENRACGASGDAMERHLTNVSNV